MRLYQLAIAAALLPASSILHAEQSPEVVVVTATRTPQNLNQTLANTSVIDAADIQRLQAFDLVDVLRSSAGIDFLQSGGPGSTSSLFVRGTNSSHVLILLNGQRISSATLGSTAIQHISLEQVERIEVVRGPKSSLYGSDAIGGVINIITKTADETPSVKVEAGLGSRGVQDHAASFSTRFGKVSLATGIDYYENAGWNKTTLQVQGSADRDTYRRHGGYVNFGIDFNDMHKLEFNYTHSESEIEYDNTFGCTNAITFAAVDCEPFSETRNRSASVISTNTFSPLFNLLIQAGYSSDLGETKDDLADINTIFGGPSIFETTRTSGLVQANFNLNEQLTLSIGDEYYRDKINGRIYLINASFDALEANAYVDAKGKEVDNRDNQAVFAQLQGELGYDFSFLLGVRRDDNESYGSHSTRNISLGYGDTRKYGKLVASYGTAFHAPTFNDLYWPDPFGPGNPSLDPETSKSHELSYRGETNNWRYSLSTFKTEIDDLIQWAPIDPNDPFSYWTPSNVQDVKIKGVESEIRHHVDSFSWSLTTSHTDADDRETGNELIDRAKRKATLNADYSIGRYSVGASWLAQSGRYSDTGNTVKTSGYNRWDLRASVDIWQDLSLQFKLENLFDVDYEHRKPYVEPGRTFMLKVIYSPLGS